MQVKWLLAGGAGLCVYAGTVYATMVLVRGTAPRPTAPIGCPGCACEVSKQYDKLASVYDSKVGWDEFFMGLGLLRWSMVSSAHGKVLETSAGTGRNMGYYSGAVDEVVFTDLSEQMLRQAKVKWESAPGRYQHRATFAVSDIEALTKEAREARDSSTKQSSWMILKGLSNGVFGKRRAPATEEQVDSPNSVPADHVALQPSDDFKTAVLAPGLQYTFPSESFDSCVDTFGLCSCTDPVQALLEMSRVLKPAGRLILLEHGRSHWTFLNRILDSDADLHYEKWGCWWNRDILDAVQQAGLSIDSISRWHFGTTYAIVCSKPTADESRDDSPRIHVNIVS